MSRTHTCALALALMAAFCALAAGCPSIDGYELHTSGNFCGPNTDFMGPFYNMSVLGLIDMCTKHCDCTGVTYYSHDNSGWLKDMAAGAGDACDTRPGCFYTRVANPANTCTTCATIQNYTSIFGLDHWGDDMLPKTLPFAAWVVAEHCTQTPGCVGFNSGGYLKSKADDLTAAPGSCFYTRNDSHAWNIVNAAPTSPTSPAPVIAAQPPLTTVSPAQSAGDGLQNGLPSKDKGMTTEGIVATVLSLVGVALAALTVWQAHRHNQFQRMRNWAAGWLHWPRGAPHANA